MTIYIRPDGTISGSNEPLPMKPRSSCPGRGFCTCDDPPAKRCEILEWQEALTAWKESCIDFDDQESGKWLACYSLGQSDRKLVDILDLSFDGSGRLKTDLIIENVDVETEVWTELTKLEAKNKALMEAAQNLVTAIEQRSFFQEGYRNGSASISEVMAAGDVEVKAYEAMGKLLTKNEG